jgi:sulfofructose kinase
MVQEGHVETREGVKGGNSPEFDVVGMGLNAVDHLCVVPRFPRYEEKLRMEEFRRGGGGQVASAMVACSRWGLRAAYIGKVGDGELGAFSLASLRDEGVDVGAVVAVEATLNQLAFILIDATTGERTIIWTRDDRLRMAPDEVPLPYIARGRILLLDGHDAPAAAYAAREASRLGLTVVVDAETVKEGTHQMVAAAHYVVASSEFPQRFTGKADWVEALSEIRKGGALCAVATLGRLGSVCLCGDRVIETPGFKVDCVDSTGAGDVFHAGFVYGLAMGWDIEQTLEFSNAAAALTCTEIGARAGIKPPDVIFALMKSGDRWKI